MIEYSTLQILSNSLLFVTFQMKFIVKWNRQIDGFDE